MLLTPDRRQRTFRPTMGVNFIPRIDLSSRFPGADGEHLDRRYEDGYRPEYAYIALGLCWNGATNEKIAEFFDVSVDTLNRWTFKYPDLKRHIDMGRHHADQMVMEALFQSAVGYEVDVEKIFNNDGQITRVDTKEYIAPNVAAQKFWLTNRRPDRWSNREHTELSGPGGKPIQLEDVTAREILLRRLAGLDRREEATAGPLPVGGPDG
jgi:hypothetical protein